MDRTTFIRASGVSAALLLAVMMNTALRAAPAAGPLVPARPGPATPGLIPAAPPPAAGAAAAPAAAGALQAPHIIVIDRQYILQRSSAGRDMLGQMQTLNSQADTQFRTEETQLQTEANQLQQQLAIMAPDVRDQKEKEFTAKQAAFQQRVQQRQQEIQGGFAKAARDVEVALEPILQQIMRERGANMLLDRSAVIITAADVDVTPLAIQRLDQKLPHIKVELARAPAGAGAPAPSTTIQPPPARK